VTTVTDLIHDVIGYLVAQCQVSPVLGLAATPVLVIDGPTVARDQVLAYQQRLWIGYDSVSGSADAGTATQRWPFLGASGNYREETGSIPCTAEAFSGDSNPATARALCTALTGAVEIMLRGSPTTGGPGDSTMGGLVQWSQVENFTWTTEQTENGCSAACVFHATYLARLPP
jgi:hypothetical protein